MKNAVIITFPSCLLLVLYVEVISRYICVRLVFSRVEKNFALRLMFEYEIDEKLNMSLIKTEIQSMIEHWAVEYGRKLPLSD